MMAQCIPSRLQTLTAWGAVAGGTIALCATAPPVAGLAAVGAIASAGLVALNAGRPDPDPQPAPPTNWITDIRRQPVKMRGRGAAHLMTLPLTIDVTQEATQ
jgi:RecA-family ATPase